MNKKGFELSIRLLIVLILCLIGLSLLVFFFSKSAREIFGNLASKIKTIFGIFNASLKKGIVT